MKLTLIITTYNWPEALLLVLKSIEEQIIIPNEVIIADDGSSSETSKAINSFKKQSKLNIIHAWQEDVGFRVARSRNNAISMSSGDYIVLIDGDTVLHNSFVKDHIANSEPGYFVQASRVLLSEKLTNKVFLKKRFSISFLSLGLKNRLNYIYSNFLSFIFCQKKNHLNGIKSCNMGFFKKDCLYINGFNNDFEGWGREDSEFIVRLVNSGINRKTIHFNAIQYHLWHNENSRLSLMNNDEILMNAINNFTEKCENGINMIRNES
jgi:glycosyltransferase involved in cell wall biosynthesis